MPSSPKLVATRFGAWLELQRGKRSLEQIATRVRKYVEDFGLQVHRSAIKNYEQGRIPPWPVLYAFSEIYGVSDAEIAARLFRAVQREDGRDLLRPGADQSSAPHQGGADVSASVKSTARIVELEHQLKEREALLRDVSDVARAFQQQLADLASRITESGVAPREATSGGRHRRGAAR